MQTISALKYKRSRGFDILLNTNYLIVSEDFTQIWCKRNIKKTLMNSLKYRTVVFLLRYLGSLITCPEIKSRIIAGNSCYAALFPTLRSKCISRQAKITTYRMIYRTVVFGWFQNLDLKEGGWKKVKNTCERKMLQTIYGLLQENRMYRIRKNKKLTRSCDHSKDKETTLVGASALWG